MKMQIWTPVVAALLLVSSPRGALSDTWYVDLNQTASCESQDGQSWSTCYRFLQDVLLDPALAFGDVIHVAQGGPYIPDDTCVAPGGGGQEASFVLIEGVILEGGYKGLSDPGNEDVRVDDPTLTILSGDRSGNDDPEMDLGQTNRNENSYVVVTAGDDQATLTDLTILSNFTVRDGNNPGFAAGGIHVTNNAAPTIEKCIVKRNSGGTGGGIHIHTGDPDQLQTTRVFDTVIEDNEAGQGGGLMVFDRSTLEMERCTIRTNRSTGVGGGGFALVDEVTAVMRDTVVDGNIWNVDDGEGRGGGGMIDDHAHLTIRESRIAGNEVSGEESKCHGGGLWVAWHGAVEAVNTTFDANLVEGDDARGAGAYIATSKDIISDSSMINCAFINNIAGIDCDTGLDPDCADDAISQGGGIYVATEEFGFSRLHLINVLMIWNAADRAGAIEAVDYAILDLRNCTIAENFGNTYGGLYLTTPNSEGTALLKNTVLWDNTDANGEASTDTLQEQILATAGTATPDVDFSCIQDDSPGQLPVPFDEATNIDVDPLFKAANEGDFRLTDISPARESADEGLMPEDAVDVDYDDDIIEKTPDLDLTDRIWCILDMGAFEFEDCDLDGVDDTVQIETCNADPLCLDIDEDHNGLLDFCEPVIFGSGPLEREQPQGSISLEPTTISDLQFDENWMIVGAANDDLLTNAGAVYFYRLNQIFWYGPARKTSSNSQMHNAFGRSVAISGGWAVAGAPGADGFAGEANVFKLNVPRKTWSEYDLLESPTGIYVGTTVAIHDDVIAVAGASDSAVSGSSNGLVYIHHYNATTEEWELKDALVPSVGNALYFGLSLAVGEDWIAVGYSVDESGLPAGVEMFHYDGTDWDENVLLDYPGLSDQDESGFGISVAMEDDLMVVGAVGYGPGDGNGEAYVYHLDAGVWTHVEALNVDDVGADDLFGRDVDVRPTLLQDSVVLVGAPLQEANDSGAAYMFMLNECHDEYLSHELQPDSPMSGGNFGHPLSQSGLHGVILHPRGQSADMLLSHVVTWSWVN